MVNRPRRVFQLEGTARDKAQRPNGIQCTCLKEDMMCTVSEMGWKTGVTEMQVKSADCTLLCSFTIVLTVFLD